MRRSRRETELELAAVYGELERLRDEIDDLLETDGDPLIEHAGEPEESGDDQ